MFIPCDGKDFFWIHLFISLKSVRKHSLPVFFIWQKDTTSQGLSSVWLSLYNTLMVHKQLTSVLPLFWNFLEYYRICPCTVLCLLLIQSTPVLYLMCLSIHQAKQGEIRFNCFFELMSGCSCNIQTIYHIVDIYFWVICVYICCCFFSSCRSIGLVVCRSYIMLHASRSLITPNSFIGMKS